MGWEIFTEQKRWWFAERHSLQYIDRYLYDTFIRAFSSRRKYPLLEIYCQGMQLTTSAFLSGQVGAVNVEGDPEPL